MPSRWSFARRHMLDTGELMWTSVKRVGTRGIRPPRWCRREHATTGADQTLGPRPVTLSQRAARCWPSAGLRGGQLAVSSQVPWKVCGRLPLRGYRGPGPVRASVVVEAGVTPAVHLHGPAPLATPHHHSVKCHARLARKKRTKCNRGCGTCGVGPF